MSIWDEKWKERQRDVFRWTSTQPLFSQRAYRCLAGWLDGNEHKFLEVGCGTGKFCIQIAMDRPAADVTGIDVSPEALSLATRGAQLRGIENARFMQGDAFEIPFQERQFDVVFSEGMIEHFQDYETPLREMLRVTKPGGKLIVAVPNWYCLPHTFQKVLTGPLFEYGYERSFRHKELKLLYEKYGLKQVEFRGFLPTYCLSRQGVVWDYIARFIEAVVIKPLDAGSGDAVSRLFGFEIWIKGIK